jgi:hypothetical protein
LSGFLSYRAFSSIYPLCSPPGLNSATICKKTKGHGLKGAEQGENAMDHDVEIRDLKASLLETKLALVGLVTCIARTLAESDPKLAERLTRTFEEWHRGLSSRPRSDAREIAVMFGRAFVDPAFPLSPTPPED